LTCVGHDPKAAEAKFRARLAEVGAELLEVAWLGVNTPHRIRCNSGHETSPRPGHVAKGRAICWTCSGRNPEVPETAFRARLAEVGAALLEERWLGSLKPHRIRCVEGHDVTTRPSHVLQGRGVCRVCAGKTWDALYVVHDALNGIVKPGITSGDPRPRLADHERDGFDEVIRVHANLPDGVALELESTVLAALEDAKIPPIRGREYFPEGALPVILDLVDNHPAIRAAAD
jgi:hypothetical protein